MTEKTHQMRLLITTDADWGLDEVVEQAHLILQEVQLDDGPFKEIHVLPDINDDTALPVVVNTALVNIQAHAIVLRNRAKREGIHDKMEEALNSIAYGVSLIKRVEL